MKIHKEIVWNKGVNPEKDGEYLIATFLGDGSFCTMMNIYYTVKYGWNTSDWGHEHSWGQSPHEGAYMWANLPF